MLDSPNKTTVIEIMLDVFFTIEYSGKPQDAQTTWSIYKDSTEYMFNLKSFFANFIPDKAPLILKKGSTLSKYRVATTCMTLPFSVSLANKAKVVETMTAMSQAHDHVRYWLIHVNLDTKFRQNLPEFGTSTPGNLFRIQRGLEPTKITYLADKQRELFRETHNKTATSNADLHLLGDVIPPEGDPPTNQAFPSWWFTNARFKCIRCQTAFTFKNLKRLVMTPCHSN